MSWSDIAQAAAATAQASASLAAPALDSRRAWKYTKKSMALQEKYNQAAFERENERQDYLMQNAYSINKQALKEAGYSAADPNGTGLQAPATNTMDTPSGTPFTSGSTQIPDILGSVNSILSLREQLRGQRLTNEAQSIENEINKVYADRLKKAETEKAEADARKGNVEATVAEDTIEAAKLSIEQDAQNKLETGALTYEQFLKTQKEIEVLDESLKAARIQNTHLEDKIVSEIRNATTNAAANMKNAAANYQNALNSKDANRIREAELDLSKQIQAWAEHIDEMGLNGISNKPGAIQTLVQSLLQGKKAGEVGLNGILGGLLDFFGLPPMKEIESLPLAPQ